MSPGLEKLRHIVVLMMENRSFDHMLGSLGLANPAIDGIRPDLTNIDTEGNSVKPQPLAEFQGQLDPDPDHHFHAVDLQIFNRETGANRAANMGGFIRSYFEQKRDVKHSHKILYYFPKEKLPVITTLALEFAVFTRWFSSIPGPTICNRAFAHYGTSFGRVGMDMFYPREPFKSVYQRLLDAGRTAKIYYYDHASSTMEVVNLLQNQPLLFGTFPEFLIACERGELPDYSFIEPNFSDHDGDGGEELANDQHPDHHVQAGELFIAQVYSAIRRNSGLWESTALLITYDEHGGIYDHVIPPNCIPDGFIASPNDTGTGMEFRFDRLGVRVPAILVSPWIPEGTVVSDRIFEHASIPATVTEFFVGDYEQRSPREKAAERFVERRDGRAEASRNLFSKQVMRTDCIDFEAD